MKVQLNFHNIPRRSPAKSKHIHFVNLKIGHIILHHQKSDTLYYITKNRTHYITSPKIGHITLHHQKSDTLNYVTKNLIFNLFHTHQVSSK
jgi:hypothetical protein